MTMKKILPLISFFLLIENVKAHCPLCTVGAAAAAGGAAYLGVDKAVIGLFIGAFAISTGLWLARAIRKQFIPFQRQVIVLASFLLTIIPLMPVISSTVPYYLSLGGEYGTLLNRTYLINLPLFTSMFGGLVVFISPAISRQIMKIRNGKFIPFQGIIITLLSLILTGALLQAVL